MSELQAQRNKLNEALSLMQQKEAAEAKALAERGAAIHHLKSETAGFKVRFEPCGFLGGFGGVFGGGRGGKRVGHVRNRRHPLAVDIKVVSWAAEARARSRGNRWGQGEAKGDCIAEPCA